MNHRIEKILNSPISKIWNIFTHPAKISMHLESPPPLSNTRAIKALFPDLKADDIESRRLELLNNSRFLAELNKKMVEKRHRQVTCGEYNEFLYMSVRFLKPEVVFETGVFDGRSSAVILQALHDNGDGLLVSIDLPAVKTIKNATHTMPETILPFGCQPGWLIPEYLKPRHRLVLGDSRQLLPKMLIEYPRIDIFFHDSLHTFDHMYFEYSAAWSHIEDGGLLITDDIYWSTAFHRFCKEQKSKYVRIESFGATRKQRQ